MKALKLTDEQKDKLIEMSKHLYKNYEVEIGEGDRIEFTVVPEKWEEGSEDNNMSYHWFEFLVLTLVVHLFDHPTFSERGVMMAGSLVSACIVGEVMKKPIHPVDQLYKVYQEKKSGIITKI